jgi:hypothetical protein
MRAKDAQRGDQLIVTKARGTNPGKWGNDEFMLQRAADITRPDFVRWTTPDNGEILAVTKSIFRSNGTRFLEVEWAGEKWLAYPQDITHRTMKKENNSQ